MYGKLYMYGKHNVCRVTSEPSQSSDLLEFTISNNDTQINFNDIIKV